MFMLGYYITREITEEFCSNVFYNNFKITQSFSPGSFQLIWNLAQLTAADNGLTVVFQ